MCVALLRSGSQLKVIGRYWQLSVLLLCWRLGNDCAAPQQRDPQTRPESSAVSSAPDSAVSTEQDSAVSSAQDVDESGDDSAAVKENLAERIIAVLRENTEALATAKNEIARQTSADPSTISDEAIFRRIRQSSELQARIAQELSARGYDLSERGSGGSVRERGGNDDRDSREQRSDRPERPRS